jgi:hypothetical protein
VTRTARLARAAAVPLGALVLASPGVAADGATATTLDVRARFSKEVAAVDRGTKIRVLLPRALPADETVRRLYLTGFHHPDRWSLTIAAAPRCGTSTACFVASFEGRRGMLVARSNVRLPGGQPARYVPPRCGASCGPATLTFVVGDVVYEWRVKDPPAGGAKALSRLAGAAIARR